MARIDDLLIEAVKAAGRKPDDSAKDGKGPWSTKISAKPALAVAQELRERGMVGTRPSGPGEVGVSGAERRPAGGIGAKKVGYPYAQSSTPTLPAGRSVTIYRTYVRICLVKIGGSERRSAASLRDCEGGRQELD